MHKKKRVPPGDVMKTPLLKDLSALRLCNPPVLRLLLWPAIDKRRQLGFQCNLMSIPIEPAQLPVLFAKIRKKNESAMLRPHFFMCEMQFFLIGKERIVLHRLVDLATNLSDDLLILRIVEHFLNPSGNLNHQVLLGTTGGDGGSAETDA